ncbi:MAG: alpha-2-macroglobulin family protein [Oscillatoriales cyanobacterium C42_A2020_001]|nr:alpha-2-macroglobulin family protein [Leptolyngbyaceae cyanobacterium C42_A2020_001]
MRLGKRFIVPVLFLLGVLIAVGFAGCGTANITNAPQTVEVAELPAPNLPDWIEEISPLGNAKTQAQIRVRFKEPLIPVESLESDDQRQLLQKFEVVPPLKGQFRFLTPRMVGFQADEATPLATRVRVTLKAGLADLKNHKLDQDLAWTFQTDRIKLTNLPTSYSADNPKEVTEPLNIKPVLKVYANTELDQASLKEHAKLIPNGKNDSVSLAVTLEKQPEVFEPDTPNPEKSFDPSTRSWIYTLQPQRELDKATQYKLEFTPGLRSAKGNLPTEESFASQVETFSPLAYQTLKYFGQPDASGTYGRFVKGSGQLEFNNPLNVESALANISISPEPKNKDVPLVRAYEGDRVINLNPWALEPTTKYTVTVGADIKDKFGQTLGRPVTVDYETGDVAPDIWAPTDLNIFPASAIADKALQLNISTVNLSEYKSAFEVVQPTDLVYVNSAYPQGNGTDLLPNPGRWKKSNVQPKKNESVETTVPLQKLLGGSTGMLAYGVQARTNSYQEDGKQKFREPAFYGMVQLTNLGVFAQWFPEAGLVRVHHLSDGSPAANAPVQIYKSQLESKDRSTPSPCATGKTDSSGMLMLNNSQFQGCRNPGAETAPPLLVIAQEGKDWAFTRTYEYSGAYDYGIDAGWESGKPISRGTIFSDRQLYQPNETAYLTGAAYYLQAGELKQDKNAKYTITLQRPDGQKKELGTQTTTQFGTFSLPITLEKTQPLGTYTVQAKSENGAEITGEFRVAEFKPPNFKVALTLNAPSKGQSGTGSRDLLPISPDDPPASIPIALPEQSVEAKVQSNYLFGPPVQAGEAQYYVTRQQTEFAPQGWEGYAFGRRWFWPEETPEVSSDVLQTTQILSNEGQGTQNITVEKDLPYPMTYRVDAQVSDVSNLSVADSQTFVALPSDRLIGLKTDFVANAGKELSVQVIVTDPSGTAIANQNVRIELQKMNYSNITRVVEGSGTSQNQVEYQTVAAQELNSKETAQTAFLTVPDSGSYRIRATIAGSSEASATDLQIWATGNEATFWGDRYRNNRLELKLDKKAYRPGELATVLIQSPYPDAELYFAVVRHDTIYQTVTKVNGSAPQIQFTVTPDMAPNAAVEAVLVRQGKPLEQTEPGSLNGLVRIGFAPFTIGTEEHYLNLEVKPAGGAEGAPMLEPGSNQTVELTLKNNVGSPVKGQFTVMVVNEAVLQLSGYRPPDLVKTVFAEQPISTRLSDNRPDVVLTPIASPLQKGWGYGGGLSAGAANTRTRTDFKPVAYYNGSVVTDGNGKAKVTFQLPDDLTTWRVMAVATDGNFNFGNADATFVTSKPVVSNPILPQFARPGDRFQAGVSVTNNTGAEGDLSVTGNVAAPLKFDNNSGSQQARAGVGTNAYRFPVLVDQPGTATVKFSSQLNGNTDAFEVPLEVKPLTVMEQVVESGTTDSQKAIPINVDKNVANDAGGLDLSLASSLVPQLTAPAQQVLDEQDLPFLEPAASQLSIAANLQTLSKTYGQTFAGFNPTQQATQALNRLQALKKPDGGFAAHPNAPKSDPFVTAYAAQAIAQADRVFADSALSTQTSALKTYLSKLLADPGQYDFCKQTLCKNQVRLNTLLALADLGDRRTEFVADIYAQRDQLDAMDQLRLARYLSQLPDWQSEAKTLASQLQESTYETGRNAKVNLPEGWRWFGSGTATQAEALRLAIAQKARPETIDKLAQGLLAQRRNGTWQTTYDNAEALTALVEYSQLQPTPPNFTATADLAGKNLATAQFQGYQKPSTMVNVPMANLPREKNDLVLKKSGNGILHYLVAYRYRSQGNQPGRLNGLRVTRTIRPANEENGLYTTGLYATDSLKVPVGQVYDIGLEIIADRAVDHVVITDPLPAGFEAVDNSFQTSTPYFKAKGDSWQVGYQTLYKDRVVAFGDKLNPGVYTMHYLVRSVTPGTFVYPGAEAHLQYAPEEFGRSASTTLVVEEK